MKILVIDKESLTNQLMLSKLSAAGHEVVVEPNKNIAIDRLKDEWFDCIMLDPSPLSEARPIILVLLKNIKSEIKPYLILLTKNEEMTTGQAILSATNDFLLKPLNMENIEETIKNAARFLDIFKYLSSEDNRSKNLKGIINKEAFFQLFLSSLDRAYRYGERSLIVFINIGNYDEIKKTLDDKALQEFNSKIAEKANLMRRQSDVVGLVSERDYAILLQRPQYEAEPLDAISRFAGELEKFIDEVKSSISINIEFDLDLVEIPQGILHSNKTIPYKEGSYKEGTNK